MTVDAPASFPQLAVPEATLAAVLTTLVDNAYQAGADRVQISMSVEEDKPVVTVADNGSAIDDKDRDRIFESFFTTRRESGGTGLGLAIARSLLGGSGATLALIGSKRGLRSGSLRLGLPRQRGLPAQIYSCRRTRNQTS